MTQPPILLPLSGRIVVEKFDDETTPAGIILVSAPNVEQRTTIGKVIALPGYIYDELDDTQRALHSVGELQGEEYTGLLRIGDVVMWGMNSGMVLDVGYGAARRRAIILREGEILAKVIWPGEQL